MPYFIRGGKGKTFSVLKMNSGNRWVSNKRDKSTLYIKIQQDRFVAVHLRDHCINITKVKCYHFLK